jgi:ribosomal protein S18 acetylase RimI-like enzyme
MHPLDNPIWESLGTSHARFAESAGDARRFTPAVSLLAGLREPSKDAFASLFALTAAGEAAGLFFAASVPAPEGWTVVREGPLLQMVHGGGEVEGGESAFVELGEADVPEMRALTELTKPGPFSQRTHELGGYIGVREHGKLVAMAGERLRCPGYTEVSAICTHPEHLGRGHARTLTAVVAARIQARGETPFLHVLPGNARAADFYGRMGFAPRVLLHYMLLRRGLIISG